MKLKNKNKLNKLIFKINYGGKFKPLKIRTPSEVESTLQMDKKNKKQTNVSIDVIDFKTGKKVGKYEREEFVLKFL